MNDVHKIRFGACKSFESQKSSYVGVTVSLFIPANEHPLFIIMPAPKEQEHSPITALTCLNLNSQKLVAWPLVILGDLGVARGFDR